MIIIIAARDAWMMLLVLWLAQYDYGPLPVHFVGKAGTFMLMVSIVALIFCDIWVNPSSGFCTSPRWPPASGASDCTGSPVASTASRAFHCW